MIVHRHRWIKQGSWGAGDPVDEPRVAWRKCLGCRTAVFTRVPPHDYSLPYQLLRLRWTVRIERAS